jgi:ABC-type uncharacterized transport system ATPase subunit
VNVIGLLPAKVTLLLFKEIYAVPDDAFRTRVAELTELREKSEKMKEALADRLEIDR